MKRLDAYLRGIAVFVYFFFATVWLPDLILGLEAVAGGSKLIRDLIGLVVWGVGLGAGIWMLRRAQGRGLV